MAEPLDLHRLSLAEIARAVAEQRLPPVERWNPTHCGDSEMRIARDGRWFHQGAPINRAELVRLFATILRREEDGSYVLVTPGEKLSIRVEDLPFLAVEVRAEGKGAAQRLAFRLNTDELVVADAAHPLVFATGADGPEPRLHVRGGLEARVSRALWYELADLALAADPPGLWSADAFFPLPSA